MNMENYFSNLNLDIRTHKLGTFTDQKVTPDVLCAVAECISEYVEKIGEIFSINDIRYSDYAEYIATAVFKKPSIENAGSEYDKFFSQPIKMLSYCGVLSEEKFSRSYRYGVQNNKILQYIANRERNALNFIQAFSEKLLEDSGIYPKFADFFAQPNKNTFESMKTAFTDLVIQNTPKNTEVEVRRIFTKIINPLAYKHNTFGTRKGSISNTPITLDELYYNRLNWRDKGKEKSLTRKEAQTLFADSANAANLNYLVNKATKFVKTLHKTSEVQRFDSTEANQAHHIFMASEFPDLASLPENLICLTPNQHFNLAHPSNKTTVIDKHYQRICLMAKLDSIEQDNRANTGNYDYHEFIHVLNTGFNTDQFDVSMSYETLKHRILMFDF